MILLKNQKKSISRSGFTLLEVMASTLILLIVAAITAQLLASPQKKVRDLANRVEVVSYMGDLFDTLRDLSKTPSLPTAPQVMCSDSAAGVNRCADHCDPSVCSNFATDCNGSSVNLNNAQLNDLVIRNPNLCYVKVLIDPTCGGSSVPGPKEAQICAYATWPGKEGGKYIEGSTAYFFRP